MSPENLELCRRGWEAFKAGLEREDFGAAFDTEFFAPDLEWLTPKGFPGPSVYRGREGFIEFMRAWTEDFTAFSLNVERFVDAGDNRIVGLFHHRAVGKRSGVPVELRQGLIYEVEHGRIVRCRNYNDHGSALKAAGLEDYRPRGPAATRRLTQSVNHGSLLGDGVPEHRADRSTTCRGSCADRRRGA